MFLFGINCYKPTDRVSDSVEFEELLEYRNTKSYDSINFGLFHSLGNEITHDDLFEFTLCKWLDNRIKLNYYCSDEIPYIIVFANIVAHKYTKTDKKYHTLASIITNYRNIYNNCDISYHDFLKNIVNDDIPKYCKMFTSNKNNEKEGLKKILYELYLQAINKLSNHFINIKYLNQYQNKQSRYIIGDTIINYVDISKYSVASWLCSIINKELLCWNSKKIHSILIAASRINELIEKDKKIIQSTVPSMSNIVKMLENIWTKCDDYLSIVQEEKYNKLYLLQIFGSPPEIIKLNKLFVSALSVHIMELYEAYQKVNENVIESDIELEEICK